MQWFSYDARNWSVSSYLKVCETNVRQGSSKKAYYILFFKRNVFCGTIALNFFAETGVELKNKDQIPPDG